MVMSALQREAEYRLTTGSSFGLPGYERNRENRSRSGLAREPASNGVATPEWESGFQLDKCVRTRFFGIASRLRFVRGNSL